MAAVLGDLLQLVDNQTYLEQQVLNIYYYRVTSITGLGADYLEALNTYWEGLVLDAITPIQMSNLTHVSREWRNLSNGLDFFVENTPVVGELSTDTNQQEPSFLSAGFLLLRESLATRNGYKRFAGLSETDVVGNAWVGGSTRTNALATALASDLQAGLVTIAEPVIVRRPLIPPVASYTYSSIGAAQFRGIGTQNTRKQGRGT